MKSRNTYRLTAWGIVLTAMAVCALWLQGYVVVPHDPQSQNLVRVSGAEEERFNLTLTDAHNQLHSENITSGSIVKRPVSDGKPLPVKGLEIISTGDGGALTLDVELENELGKMRVTGGGALPFADITLWQGETEIAQSKADWSGRFEFEQALYPGAENDPYRLALYRNDTAGTASDENPLMVDVFYAPRGGGPTSRGVNDYITLFCGDPVLSVCVKSRMDNQIDKVVDNYDRALLMMGEQFSAVQSQYTSMIGMFLDAKHQMEAQRLHEQLTAEAHKDYHPSDQMCRFGSFVKSVGKTDRNVQLEQQAINRVLMDSYLAGSGAYSSEGAREAAVSRIEQFRAVYCDPADNNHGLASICQSGNNAAAAKRLNKDIDYVRTVDFPLTIDVDFSDGQKTPDEEDVIALARNLYWFKSLPHGLEEGIENDSGTYLEARRLFAMQNVAHNSFAHLVAEKSSSPENSQDSGARYMKALLKEMGVNDNEIDGLLGNYPSYYAQMDVLTKKIYQSPHFYTNLYDKPVNVKRISVAMDAIKLMQMRDMHEASMRREMLGSLLLEQALKRKVDEVNGKVLWNTSSDSFLNFGR